MLRQLSILAVMMAAVGFGVYWWLTIPATISASALPAYTPDLANGKITFNAAGCSSCHAVPKQEDRTRLGGGLALASPFGTFYVPNISPDPVDGIGRWTEAEFVTAVNEGTSPAGQHYFPAFPYAAYHQARLSDVRDLFAYLNAVSTGRIDAPDNGLPDLTQADAASKVVSI